MSKQFWEHEECAGCNSFEKEVLRLEAERDKLRERVKELQRFIANYWGASDPPRNETQRRFDAEAQKIVETKDEG